LKTKYTRRDFLTGLVNRFQQKDSLDQKTGFDDLSRRIDLHIKHSEYQEAIHCLKELLAKSPDHLQARRKLGYCYQQTQELDQAVEEFKSVLQILEKDNFSLLYLGLVMCKKGQIDQAFKYWKKYFNVDKPHIQRRLNLYIGYYESGVELSGSELVREVEEAISEQKELG